MEKDFLTIQDTSVLLGKSVQTVRRLIKKGELKAQKIKTPQGFHYVIQRESLGIKVLSSSPIQNENTELEKADEEVLTNQNSIPTSQSDIEVQKKAIVQTIDKKAPPTEEIPAELPNKLTTPEERNEMKNKWDNGRKNVRGNEIKSVRRGEEKNERKESLVKKMDNNNNNNNNKEREDDKPNAEQNKNPIQIKYVGRIEKIVEKTMECEKCEGREDHLRKVLKRQHVEKMGLIRVLEKLQNDLDFERRRPRSLLGYLMDWLLK